LIIDDDVTFRTLIGKFLASDGWRVLEAEDGETGLNLAEQHRPELVLCDLLMPRCNGFQVCRRLRAHPDLAARTRIIVTTGSVYPADRLNALEAGANEYLAKPFRPPTLVQVITRLLEEAPAGTGASPQKASPGSEAWLRFWGVRGSIASPGAATAYYGGNTSCVEVRADGQLIVLDAGTGIRLLGDELNRECGERPLDLTVLITHTHWDHIQGFPFFTPAYNPRNHIHILGYEGAVEGLASTLRGQMQSPYFPVTMREMPGHITVQELKELEFRIGSIRVQAHFLNHPGVTVGYRLNTSAGAICYLPDNEPFQRFKLSTDEVSEESLEFARARDQQLVSFLRGADVLILDAQYDATEYPGVVGWGHSCVEDAVTLALNAGAKQLFLFHHDPRHDDEKVAQMLAGAREQAAKKKSKLRIEAAREGLAYSLTKAK
jgi:phosphoribosyl 1,2-cyclic phosphodiesterase/CheY-like chemotaxis protein